MINKVTLVGRLGQDPELKQLQNDNQVCQASLATSESYKDKAGEWQQSSEWHNLVIWGDNGSRFSQMPKGTLLFLEGKIKTQKYQDKEGKDRYSTKIVVSYFRRLEKKEGQQTATAYSSNNQNTADDLPF